MNKLVIFDCDGVLVDSEHLANQALVDCLAEVQVTLTLDEAMQNFKGKKMADCFAELRNKHNCHLPENFALTLRQRMSEYFESHLQPVNGIAMAIERISHSKCVASNGPLDKTKRNLEITGLRHHFGENIFSAYTIQKWKPEPDLFIHACKTMESEPRNSVVIEDSELGVKAALAGGFKVLAYGYHASSDKNMFPFQDMSELPALIDRVFSTP